MAKMRWDSREQVPLAYNNESVSWRLFYFSIGFEFKKFGREVLRRDFVLQQIKKVLVMSRHKHLSFVLLNNRP